MEQDTRQDEISANKKKASICRHLFPLPDTSKNKRPKDKEYSWYEFQEETYSYNRFAMRK